MYATYEGYSYFRSFPLVFDYRLFYHIDEASHTVILHRVIRGMRDLPTVLGDEWKP